MTRSARTHQACRFAGGRPCSIKGDKMNRPNRNLFAALSGISWLALCPPVMAQQNEAPATAVSEEDGSAPGDNVDMARKREERQIGRASWRTECVSTCRTGGAPVH